MQCYYVPRQGEVVLALVGKHAWWPALVQSCPGTAEESADEKSLHLYFFGDHKEGMWRPSKTRPFAHLDRLSVRERPKSALYALAVSEAQMMARLDATDSASEAEKSIEGERCTARKGRHASGIKSVSCGCGTCAFCADAARWGITGCHGCGQRLGVGCIGACVGICQADGSVTEPASQQKPSAEALRRQEQRELEEQRAIEARFEASPLEDGLVVPPSFIAKV